MTCDFIISRAFAQHRLPNFTKFNSSYDFEALTTLDVRWILLSRLILSRTRHLDKSPISRFEPVVLHFPSIFLFNQHRLKQIFNPLNCFLFFPGMIEAQKYDAYLFLKIFSASPTGRDCVSVWRNERQGP